MRKKTIFIFFVFSLCFTQGRSQISLYKAEEQLKVLFHQLKTDTIDESRNSTNNAIFDCLQQLLLRESTLDYSFSNLPFLTKRMAPDKIVAVYTWSFFNEHEQLTFNCIVQRKTSNGIRLYAMSQNKPYVPSDMQILSDSNWYGANYFDIRPFRARQGKVYMLLGWAQNKPFLTMKVIDVLCFDDKDNICFGAYIFQIWRKERIARVVFEYNSEASTSLLYEPKQKRYVFDHLAPINSGYEGNHKYYVPDSSYDAYRCNGWKKCWIFQKNVEVINE